MILGVLIQRPDILTQTDKYQITVEDFIGRFHKIIFSAIYNLFHSGVELITLNEFNNYLKNYPELYTTFEKEGGNEVLLLAMETAELENFDYYYDRLKKLSLLRDLKNQNFDISSWFETGIYDINKRQEMEKRLENSTLQDIIHSYMGTISDIESKFINKENFKFGKAADGVGNLIEKLKIRPEMGLSFQNRVLTTVTRGARKTKLYLMSANTGVAKAIPNYTKIPTPNGFKRVDEIKVGDFLFDALGQPTKVLGVFPQGQKEVCRISFKDGRTAECCEEHLWSYYLKRQKQEEIKQRTFYTSSFEEMEKLLKRKESILIPTTRKVNFEKKELPFSPYNVGFFLGDISTKKEKTRKKFSEMKFLEVVIDYFIENQSIPKKYLQGSIEQREELLRGIMEANGSVQENVFYFSSIFLSQDLIELVNSLGGTAKLFSYLVRQNELFHKVEIDLNSLYNPIVNIKRTGKYTSMTCFTVDNKEQLFLMNDYIVTHNSRFAVANACYSAYPIRYDSISKQWVEKGNSSKTLFVTTEQEFNEIQTMIVAYLSEVNEEKILNGAFNAEEEERIKIAVGIMSYYQENLHISHLPDPNIAQLNSNIRRLAIVNKIENIYYDYIHTSPQLLAEFQGLRIREDVALLLMATALKNLANELGVFIWTSSQVNAQEDEVDFADQRVLRGSRALGDKADIGGVLRVATREKLKTIEPLLKTAKKSPNLYIDIYKNRGSKYKQVRLWMFANLGTMRFEDLFLTNEYGEQIAVDFLSIAQNIEIPSIKTILAGREEKIEPKKSTIIPPSIQKKIVQNPNIQITV